MDKKQTRVHKLIVGAIGVVYGDIGTSPLYTIKECLSHYHIQPQSLDLLGILSLIFWSILLIVCFKYATLVLRADNQGEGGILALTSLLRQQKKYQKTGLLVVVGMLGAALFCGDGLITPAISVLAALEGLELISPQFKEIILPLSIVILVMLFMMQKHGTNRIGNYFGPIMVCWFGVLGILGLIQIIQTPSVLKAINPYYAILLFARHGYLSLFILGTTILAVTGAEALYADLGHFGKKTIRRSLFWVVCPCLLLNYFGQTALLIKHPESIENPFYHLVPSWGLYPLIVLATVSTIIASQSIISGIFSMGWQAVQLGYLPRLRVLHTSASHKGQVYLPGVNYIMMICTILLVLIFKNAGNLAEAYGFVVSAIMLMTSILIGMVARQLWGWAAWTTYMVFGLLISIDLVYFTMNLAKVLHGGWLPAVIALFVFLIMHTWYQGRLKLKKEIQRESMSIAEFLEASQNPEIMRLPGTAIYMSPILDSIPAALKLGLTHYKAIHERIVLLSIITIDVPFIPPSQRIKVQELGRNTYLVKASYGFTETPHIHTILSKASERGLPISLEEGPFFMSRSFPVASRRSLLSGWKEHLFILLSRNAMNPTEYFHLPHERVVEMAEHVKI